MKRTLSVVLEREPSALVRNVMVMGARARTKIGGETGGT